VESVNFDRAAGYYDKTRALPAATMADLTGLLAAELAGRQPCLEIGVGTAASRCLARGVALATAHEAATAVRCWAFELR
jgi:hypothetical protein